MEYRVLILNPMRPLPPEEARRILDEVTKTMDWMAIIMKADDDERITEDVQDSDSQD
jgi:hypothetical protein